MGEKTTTSIAEETVTIALAEEEAAANQLAKEEAVIASTKVGVTALVAKKGNSFHIGAMVANT